MGAVLGEEEEEAGYEQEAEEGPRQRGAALPARDARRSGMHSIVV